MPPAVGGAGVQPAGEPGPGADEEHVVIRVVLPYHLRTLARVEDEVRLAAVRPVTQRKVLDALEERFPVLRGTIRDHQAQRRRPFLRFFACGQDLSLEPPDHRLPAAVEDGLEPFMVVGAMAGG